MASIDEIDDETLNQKMDEVKLWLADQVDLLPNLSGKKVENYLVRFFFEMQLNYRLRECYHAGVRFDTSTRIIDIVHTYEVPTPTVRL